MYKEIIDNSIGRWDFMFKLINQLCLQEVAINENATKDGSRNSVKLDTKHHQCQLHSKCKKKTNNHCEQCNTYCCEKHTGAKLKKIYSEKCAN